MNFNIGLDDPVAPVQVAPPAAPVESPLDQANKSVVAYGYLNVMYSIVIRLIDYGHLMGKDPSTWELEEYIKFHVVLGQLGSSHCLKGPVGILDWRKVEKLNAIATEDLRMSLVNISAVKAVCYTDFTLIEYVNSLKGSRVREEDGKAVISFPGVPTKLLIPHTGDGANRIESGGQEFVTQFNIAFGSTIKYVQVSRTARMLAFFLCARRDVDVDPIKGKVTMKTLSPGTSKVRAMASYTAIQATEEFVMNLVRSAFSDPALRPSIGHSSEKLAYIEVLIHNKLQSDTNYKNAAEGQATAIEKAYDLARAASSSSLPWKTVDNSVPIPYLSKFVQGQEVISGIPLVAQGSVMSYLTESRNSVRDQFDLVRKSDAPGIGSIGGSIVNVPVKITRAVNILKAAKPEVIKSRVEAYGTGDLSHWQLSLEACLGTKVYYRDNVPSRVPLHGGDFEKADVTRIDGDKTGVFIVDDTWVGPDNKPALADFLPKVNSIVAAKYAGGVIKLAYGVGSDATVHPAQIPRTHQPFLDAGYQIELAPGGSPHSAEYFLVFFKPNGAMKWVPAKISSLGFVGEGSWAPNGPNVEDYIRGWLAAKACEVLISNQLINQQLVAGFYSGVKMKPFLKYSGNDSELQLSGVKVPGTGAPKEDDLAITGMTFGIGM